jgi:hypothetical protein
MLAYSDSGHMLFGFLPLLRPTRKTRTNHFAPRQDRQGLAGCVLKEGAIAPVPQISADFQ